MVINLSIARLGRDQWRLTWSSDEDNPTYRVYRDGLLIGTTTRGVWTARAEAGEFPVFEVLDQTEGDPQRPYPQRNTIGWFADEGVEKYDVQQYIAGTWTTVKTVQNDGAGYYRWTSQPLADVTTHRFRVRPTGVNQNAGAVIELACLMVRIPDPPQVTFAYDAGSGEVTIAAA